MTPDFKRSKETLKQTEIRESNALPGESPDKKKVRFSSEPGDGGACAIAVEELVEDYWSDEHGEGAIYEGLHCKVEPDLDMTATEAALDRLLENGVVLDIPRDEGVGMKHLTTRWEKPGENATMSGSTKFAAWDASTGGRSSGRIFLPQELRTALDVLWTFSRSNVVCQPSLWIALMLFIRPLNSMTWW